MRPVTWYRQAYVNTVVQHQALALMNAPRLLHNMHGNLNLQVAFLFQGSVPLKCFIKVKGRCKRAMQAQCPTSSGHPSRIFTSASRNPGLASSSHALSLISAGVLTLASGLNVPVMQL